MITYFVYLNADLKSVAKGSTSSAQFDKLCYPSLLKNNLKWKDTLSLCWEGKTVHCAWLHIKTEQHDIALFHSVVLTLCTHLHTNRFKIVSTKFQLL